MEKENKQQKKRQALDTAPVHRISLIYPPTVWRIKVAHLTLI
jgi:hypothetical protein